MYSGKLVFAQVMDHLPMHTFRQAVRRYGGNPCSCLSLSTSRIFLICSLRADIASPLLKKAKHAAVRLPTSVHDPAEPMFHFPESVFHFPESMFHFLRNPCSTSSEKPTKGVFQSLEEALG